MIKHLTKLECLAIKNQRRGKFQNCSVVAGQYKNDYFGSVDGVHYVVDIETMLFHNQLNENHSQLK